MRSGNNMQVIDTHAHWYPRRFIELLQQEAAANGANMTINAKGNPVFALPGISQQSTMVPSMIEPDLILKSMDGRRIDTYALSLTNPMVYWAQPEFGLKLAQAFNDGCAEAADRHPQRFIGTVMLPMQDSALAVQELERAAKLPGMRAVYMAMGINGKNLHDTAFWPVYARCETLGMPIFLHPLYPCGIERMGEYFMRNVLGNPYESGIAAMSLIAGGVMDAFPKLVVMLPHGGGTFPWLIGRFDKAITTRRELAHLKQPASEYLRRFYYDTVTHHPLVMRNLIDLVGIDRIVLGSDYDQDMSYPQPVEFVDQIPGVTTTERELILSGNAARLLKIGDR